MPQRRTAGFAALLAGAHLAALAAGCAPQFEELGTAVDANTVEIQRLADEQTALRRDVTALLALLRSGEGSGLETDARLQTQLSQILSRLDQAAGQQTDNQEYMRNLSARVDLLTTRLGIPTLGEFKPAPTGGADLAALPEEGRALFNAAMSDRGRGDYDAARQGFLDFLDRYPRSEQADDAAYWLAAMTADDGDQQAALNALLTLLESHPDSDRRADALHKAVAAAHALGQDAEARRLLDRLQAEFPGSEAAELAGALLSE
jgi:tol-pal system protein YbgF